MVTARRQAGPIDLGGVLVLHALALAALLVAQREPSPLSATAPIMAQLIQAPASPAAASTPSKPKTTPPLAMRTPPRAQQPAEPAHRAAVPAAAKPAPRPLTTTARTPRTAPPPPAPMPRPAVTPAPREPAPSAAPARLPPVVARPAPAQAVATTPATAPDAAPRRAPGSTGKPADHRAYFAALLQRLNRFKVYPAALRKEKVEGRVVLRFTIDANGSVVGSGVERSSGHADLDRAAARMLTRASPLPAIPASMGKRRLTLSVPVEYSLLTDR